MLDGMLLTLDTLSTTLFQVAAMQGLRCQAINVVHAVAFLLKEVENEAIEEAIRDIENVQFNKVTNNLREFMGGLKEKLVEEMEGKMAALEKKMNKLMEVVEKAAQQAGSIGNASYRDALTRVTLGAPLDANPCLVAKESIRQHQSLIDLPRGLSLQDYANSVLVSRFSKAMGWVTAQKHKIRLVLKIKNSRVLVKMVTDKGAAWLASKPNAVAFLPELGESEALFKTRSYNVVTFYMPLSLNPSSKKDRKEIEETNNIPEGSLTKVRWIKPLMHR